MTTGQRKRKFRPDQPAPRPLGEEVTAPLPLVMVAMLVAARLLIPTEAAGDGQTLWMVQLWLATGLLWAVGAYRRGDYRVRIDRCDGALWLLIAGHVVAALAVIATAGDRRAALNMMWEWIGLGVGFFVIRQTVQTATARQNLLLVLVAMAVSLAGLGLWQHYLWYPQIAQKYGRMIDRLEHLEQAIPTTRQEAFQRGRQIQELQTELASQGVPTEDSARHLWEQRLRASSEPFGMFALANSFAGILLVWLLIAAAMLARGLPDFHRKFQAVSLLIAVLLLAYCLLLTKSRTAWVGLLAGIGLGAWLYLRTRPLGWNRRVILWSSAAIGLLAGFVATAALSRGVDRAVLTEAPKSLLYRLQYWTATWHVIQDYPILGTGPGNFRQHYLRYKLPESSEEILDPHNLVLDVWANGGLVALLGLLGFVALGSHTLLQRVRSPNQKPADWETRPEAIGWGGHPIIVGAGLSFGLILLVTAFLSGEPFDIRIVCLLAGWLIALVCLRRTFQRIIVPNAFLGIAWVALLIHLLGAGGIAMPAISQTLVVLLALGTRPKAHSWTWERKPTAVITATGGVLAAAFLVCAITATVPVMNCQAFVQAGDLNYQEGNFRQAETYYRQAAQYDSLSAAPWQRLAALTFQRWSNPRPSQSDQAGFEPIVELQQEAIRRDPDSFGVYRNLGNWYLEAHRMLHEPHFATAASEQLRLAAERYPHNATLQAELAEARQQAEGAHEARVSAQQALRLDAINRQAGHVDKCLKRQVVESLKQIIDRKPSLPPETDAN